MGKTTSRIDTRTARRLKCLRMYLGLTLEQVSTFTGLSSSTVCSLENGRKLVDLFSVLKVCEFYEVDPYDVVFSSSIPAQRDYEKN